MIFQLLWLIGKIFQKGTHTMYYVTSVDICIVRCVIILVECVHGDMKRTACLVSDVRPVLMEPFENARTATLLDRYGIGHLRRVMFLRSGV